MENQAFSKILILVILIVLAGGAIFAWQYFGVQKEETPGEIVEDETADWQTYAGPYPIHFSYPENLKLSEGDTNYGSVIVLKSPLTDDKDQEYSFRIYYQPSVAQQFINLEERDYTKEEDFYIQGFLATRFKGTDTPNAYIAKRTVTKIIVQTSLERTYEITDWRFGNKDDVFNNILDSINFVE
ncbi:MAG: hypothetical protein ABIB55_00145 [Candidatus Nealsonbacteria bacterium]